MEPLGARPRRQFERLRAALTRRRGVTVRPPTATAQADLLATGTLTASGTDWSNDLEQQIQILPERTDNLASAIGILRADHEPARLDADVERDALRVEHRTALSHLQAQQEAQHRATFASTRGPCPSSEPRSSSLGCPMPSWGNPSVGWPLLVAAPATTLAVVRRPSPLDP